MNRWERVTYDGFGHRGGGRLMHQWRRLIWFRLRDRKGRGRHKITLLEVVKKDMSIKVVMKSITWDRIE